MSENLKDTQVGHKNWGEVVSIAFARAMGVKYIFSEERVLQEVIDEYINLDETDPNKIAVIRIMDFIKLMKDIGIDRKKVKLICMVYKNSKDNSSREDVEKVKKWFDDEFWPL